MSSERLLSTNGVAELLRVHPKHVFRLLKRGLPGHRLGGQWRFDPKEVLAWMRSDSQSRPTREAVRTVAAEPPPLVAANGDVCVELLLALVRASKTPFGFVQADRTSGRAYLERGSVLAAGVHGDSGEAVDAAPDPLVKVHLTRRSIGLAYTKGKRLRSLRGLGGLRLASRPVTAGVRAHLEQALVNEGLDSTEIHKKSVICGSHRDVALSVLSGQSDAGIVTLAWAQRAGLGCLPIADEDYALSLRAETLAHELGKALVRTLQGAELKRLLSATAGYEPGAAGTLV